MTSTRAAIYTRQSKDTAGNGLAVARQQAEGRKLAGARGWAVTRVLTDNDTSASNGKPRPGFAELMRLVETRQVDVVVVWAVDRLVRKLADLEHVIETCERAGVRLATVSGDLDLSTDQGRLVGRILASVARGEVERKSARQKLAAQQAAAAGKRWTGCPRPFGYAPDHVSADPAEAAAIRWAADCLLGGGTISAVMREWNARGLRPPQAPFGPLPAGAGWTRQSVRTVLANPRLAGLNAYRGEITGPGQWEPVLAEGTWRAVAGLLDDPARKPARGVRTLLGGLAVCRCGNTIQGSRSYQGNAVYRCDPASRGGRPGPHTTVRAVPVDEFVEEVMVERLSRDDVAALVTPPPDVDTGALHTEAASIRRSLERDAVDEMKGVLTRAQLLARTAYGTGRLAGIAAELEAAAGASVLAPFTTGQPARQVWDGLDPSRKRAVIDALTPVIIHPAGRGARTFDPATVEIPWHRSPE